MLCACKSVSQVSWRHVTLTQALRAANRADELRKFKYRGCCRQISMVLKQQISLQFLVVTGKVRAFESAADQLSRTLQQTKLCPDTVLKTSFLIESIRIFYQIHLYQSQLTPQTLHDVRSDDHVLTIKLSN